MFVIRSVSTHLLQTPFIMNIMTPPALATTLIWPWNSGLVNLDGAVTSRHTQLIFILNYIEEGLSTISETLSGALSSTPSFFHIIRQRQSSRLSIAHKRSVLLSAVDERDRSCIAIVCFPTSYSSIIQPSLIRPTLSGPIAGLGQAYTHQWAWLVAGLWKSGASATVFVQAPALHTRFSRAAYLRQAPTVGLYSVFDEPAFYDVFFTSNFFTGRLRYRSSCTGAFCRQCFTRAGVHTVYLDRIF